MAKHQIKTTVSLDGEAQFRAALQHSEQALRKLNAELNRETSSLGVNASAQQRATVRIDALKKKIAEQEKVVATMRAAVAQANQQFGEGATVTTEWEIKLAKAENTLNKMNNELDTLNMSLQDTSNTMEESSQHTANMAQGLNLLKGVAAGAASSVKQVFDTMLNNVKTVVSEIISLTEAAMAAVGNYKGISDVYGGSDENIQKFLFGASGYGVDYTTVTGALKNLVQRTDSSTDGTIDDILGKIKAPESNYTNHWDFFEGVINGLRDVTEKAKRDQYIRQLFGDKSFESVTKMIEHLPQMKKNISNAQGAGAFLTQDQIDAVDSYSNSIAELQTNLQKLKETVGAGLIISLGMEDLSKDATKALQDVLALFNAANSGDQEGMKNATISLSADVNILADDISNVLTTLSTIGTNLGDALKMSDNPIFTTLGTTLEVFGDLIGKFGEWLKDDNNKQTLGKILNAAFINKMAEWMTGDSLTGWMNKILSALGDIAAAIALLRGGNPITPFAGAGAGAGVAKSGGKVANFLKALGPTALKFSPWLVGLAATLWPAQGGNDDLTPEQIEQMKNWDGKPLVMNADGSVTRMSDYQVDTVNQSKIKARERNALLSGTEYETSGKAWEQYGNLFRQWQSGGPDSLLDLMDKLAMRFEMSQGWIDKDNGTYDPSKVVTGPSAVNVTLEISGERVAEVTAPLVSQKIGQNMTGD